MRFNRLGEWNQYNIGEIFKQSDYYMMLAGDEAPHILANQLMATLRVPVRQVSHLPALISPSIRTPGPSSRPATCSTTPA